MTLRTWGLLAFLGICAIIFSAHAHGESLWDEMGSSSWKLQSVTIVKAKVISIEARESSLVYKISADGDTSSITLCPGLAPESVNTVMQAAFHDKEKVELGLSSSPFNKCLVTAKVSKKA